MSNIDLSTLSSDQLAELLAKKKAEEQQAANSRREAYEAMKADFVVRVIDRTRQMVGSTRDFFRFIVDETGAFYEIMKEYGSLRRKGQEGYVATWENLRVEKKSCKVKRFDERADIAAVRLIEFLRKWIEEREAGSDDPMYQLAMTLLERNKYGDLDYKSISKLYDLEAKFNSQEYSEIVQLFKESNVTEATAFNYYFFERDELGVWRRLEPSFNRMAI